MRSISKRRAVLAAVLATVVAALAGAAVSTSAPAKAPPPSPLKSLNTQLKGLTIDAREAKLHELAAKEGRNDLGLRRRPQNAHPLNIRRRCRLSRHLR